MYLPMPMLLEELMLIYLANLPGFDITTDGLQYTTKWDLLLVTVVTL
jgi:hypothetical protein